MIGRVLLVIALVGVVVGCTAQHSNAPAPNWTAAPPAPYGYGASQLPPAGAPPPPFGYPMETYDTSFSAGHQQNVQRMCSDPNFAYESGYNTGLERKRLDTTWVDTSCAFEVRQATRTAYQNGFQTGIENAPVKVRVYGGGGGGTVVAERCRFSSDCGDGRTCRANQCMGDGYAGDACWFSSDCLSNSCNLSQKTCN